MIRGLVIVAISVFSLIVTWFVGNRRAQRQEPGVRSFRVCGTATGVTGVALGSYVFASS